jgi:hypothetical protein
LISWLSGDPIYPQKVPFDQGLGLFSVLVAHLESATLNLNQWEFMLHSASLDTNRHLAWAAARRDARSILVVRTLSGP